MFYHGTTAHLESFRPLTHFGTRTAAQDRIKLKGLMTGNPSAGLIYPVRLNIRNPATFSDDSANMYVPNIAYSLAKDYGTIPYDDKLFNSFSPSFIKLEIIDGKRTINDIYEELLGSPNFYEQVLSLNQNHPDYAFELCGILGQMRFINYMHQLGFDGLVYENLVEGQGQSYVTFRSDQAIIASHPEPFDPFTPSFDTAIPV